MQKIAPAFVAAKKSFGPALKDKNNPAFRSKYADLGACIDAVEEALLANGIAFYQETSEDPTGVTVETVFLHESGESLRCGKLHVPASKQDPQGYGSALTYARRYSLMASCGIAPEDDDGNAASKPTMKSGKLANETKNDPVQNIIAGVGRGDASGAATYLAGLTDAESEPIWNALPRNIQEQLRAAWPKANGQRKKVAEHPEQGRPGNAAFDDMDGHIPF